MTQKNIYVMDIIVDKMANGTKLSKALEQVYSKRRICIPYKKEIFNVLVLDLSMSNRTANGLMRAKLKTLSDVIYFCKDKKITDVTSLGKSSGTEVLEAILDYCWDNMNEEEKVYFLIDTVERNSKYIRVEII